MPLTVPNISLSVALAAVAGGVWFKCGGTKYGGRPEIAGLAAGVVLILALILYSTSGGAEEPIKSVKKKKKNKKSSKAAKKEATSAPKEVPLKPKPKAKKSEPKPKAKKSEPKKEQAPKKKKSKGAKEQPKKHPVIEDSDSDEYNLERLLPTSKKSGGPRPVYQADSSSDDDNFGIPASNVEMSKSALRRKKQKEKQAKEAATAAFNKSQSSQIDADGFEKVVVKRRPRKPAGVTAAAATPTKAAEKAAQNSEEFPMESKYFGALIGPGGATLNKYQDACNVRISVPDRESDKRTVTITGEPADIANCKKHLKSLITKGYSAITDPNMFSTTISVGPKHLGVLIGPGGKNIKAIQEKLNVKINTPDRNSESSKVTVSGLKEPVQAAKAAIKMLIEKGFSTLTHEGWTALEVAFPREEFGTLIGPGGQTIKSIQGDTKTKINIPDASNPNQNVVVVGEARGVASAIKQISGLLEKRAAREAAEAERREKEGQEEEDHIDDPDLDQYLYHDKYAHPDDEDQ